MNKTELIVYSAENSNISIQGIYKGRNIYGDLEEPTKYGANLHLVSYNFFDKDKALELSKLLCENKLKITIEKVNEIIDYINKENK